MNKIKAIVFDWDKMVYHEPILFSKYFSQKHGVPLSEVTEFFTHEFGDCLVGKLDIKKVLPKYFVG